MKYINPPKINIFFDSFFFINIYIDKSIGIIGLNIVIGEIVEFLNMFLYIKLNESKNGDNNIYKYNKLSILKYFFI